MARRFPPGFAWGAATSAYQIEGSVAVDGPDCLRRLLVHLAYDRRFGLVHVDFATQRRTVKAGGQWYAALAKAARQAR